MDRGIKGMTRKEWQRTVEGGARCRRLDMCVNGASRVAGGSGWSAYERYRHVFFVGTEWFGGCDGFGGAIGGKEGDKQRKFERN